MKGNETTVAHLLLDLVLLLPGVSQLVGVGKQQALLLGFVLFLAWMFKTPPLLSQPMCCGVFVEHEYVLAYQCILYVGPVLSNQCILYVELVFMLLKTMIHGGDGVLLYVPLPDMVFPCDRVYCVEWEKLSVIIPLCELLRLQLRTFFITLSQPRMLHGLSDGIRSPSDVPDVWVLAAPYLFGPSFSKI